MVINSSDTFFSMIDDFDPNDKVLLENIGDVLIQYPNFQLLRVLYLKSIKSQNSKDFDKALSHASISTYDRELLYEFLDTDIIPNKIKEEQIHDKLNENIKEKRLSKMILLKIIIHLNQNLKKWNFTNGLII